MTAQQMLIRSFLEKNGYQVSVAGDGLEGFKQAKTLAPDLIIMDTNMPKMNGIMVCGLLKKDMKTKTIPVLMLSARDSDNDTALYKQAQAEDFLPKPFKEEELVAVVKKLLDE
jgi:DNA-binding response OmpR family regulator